MSDIFVPITFIFILAIVVFIVFTNYTKKGKELMFGGKIIKTFGDVSAKGRIFSSSFTVTVHAVDRGATRMVTLEIRAGSADNKSMTPITLPAKEAKRLAEMLFEASEYKANA